MIELVLTVFFGGVVILTTGAAAVALFFGASMVYLKIKEDPFFAVLLVAFLIASHYVGSAMLR